MLHMILRKHLCQVVTVLLCAELHIASGNTFYIVTSSTSPCPGEFTGVPCLTLQEYASNPSRSQNITFIVEPGLHTLSKVLAVSDGYNFTMSSTNATVTCTTTNARFTFDRFENVHISGMTFQRCHSAIQIKEVTAATLTGNRFINNKQTTFVYGEELKYGGSLYLSSSSVTITKCEFQNNRAYYSGGAIYGIRSKIAIYKSQFLHNNAENGGAIYFEAQNYATLSIEIAECEFHHNKARGRGSGAISFYSLQRSFTFSVKRSVFSHNNGSQGGAISLEIRYTEWYTPSTIIIDNSTFSYNSAYADKESATGGAVHIARSNYGTATVKLRVTQNYYYNNTASHYGGALAVLGTNSSINVTSTSFIHNTARISGGALFTNGSNTSVEVTGSSFINNAAIIEGGGAIHSNGSIANASLSLSSFNSNSASYCGVLDVSSLTENIVNLTNSVFTHNRAIGQSFGGGVACIRNASINVINSTFKHNYAQHSHAGVLYIDESVTTVDRSSFINNTAVVDGGVFYTYLRASDYTIARSQFSNNSAGDDGGVIYIRLNSYVSIDESVLDSNSANDRGGVMAVIASSLNMEIRRTNIYNNTAQYGGVISACNSQITFLEESLNVTADPVLSSCMLYEGDIHSFGIELPSYPVIPTLPPITITTELPTNNMDTEPANTEPISTIRSATIVRQTSEPGITTDASHTTASVPINTQKQPTTEQKIVTPDQTKQMYTSTFLSGVRFRSASQ